MPLLEECQQMIGPAVGTRRIAVTERIDFDWPVMADQTRLRAQRAGSATFSKAARWRAHSRSAGILDVAPWRRQSQA